MAEMTTIPVSKVIRDKLKNYGLKGETYNDILQHLMNKVDYNEFMERQYKFLEEKEKFISLDEIE